MKGKEFSLLSNVCVFFQSILEEIIPISIRSIFLYRKKERKGKERRMNRTFSRTMARLVREKKKEKKKKKEKGKEAHLVPR